MAQYRLEDVRAVLAEPNAKLRSELHGALQEMGFEEIVSTGNMLPVSEALDEGRVDLLIGDTRMPEGSLSDVIYDMRHGALGGNPFVVTITLCSEPDQATVRDVVNSGTDAVLLKPFSAEQLTERIVALCEGRKRFVVTTDYIGPDRRTKARPGSMEVPLIEVPNPLRHRALGQMDRRRLDRAVENAVIRINEEKVERHADQIGWLVEHLGPAFDSGVLDEEALDNLDRLVKVSTDIGRRMKTTRYLHVAGMCMSVGELAAKLKREKDAPDPEDLRLLGTLPPLIQRAFASEAVADPDEPGAVAGSAGQPL